MKAGLAAAAAFLLAACLRNAPLVEPDRVYDADEAIRKVALPGLDSVAIFLVDAGDSARSILLWAGSPAAAADLPTHIAVEGKRYHFRIEGYRLDRGACFLAEVRDGWPDVRRNECAPRPVRADSLLDLAEDFLPGDLRIRKLAEFVGWIHFTTRQAWIRLGEDSLLLDAARDSARIGVWSVGDHLELGQHAGSIQIRDGSGRILDTVRVTCLRKRARIFALDTVHFAPGNLGLEMDATVPLTSNPDWLDVPEVPWLRVWRRTDSGIRPGETVHLVIQAIASDLAEAHGGVRATLYARGHDSRAMDSVLILADRVPTEGVIHGRVTDWTTGAPVPDAKVDPLSPGGWSNYAEGVVSDSTGRYRIPKVGKADLRLRVTHPDRIGSLTALITPGRDTALDLPVSPAFRFRELILDGDHGGVDGIAFQGPYALVALRGNPGGGRIQVTFHQDPTLRKTLAPILDSGALLGRTEAADFLAGADALFLSYPDDSALTRITDWNGSPKVRTLRLPFAPYGLLRIGELLYCAGRRSGGEPLLAEISVPELALIRLDSPAPEAVARLPAHASLAPPPAYGPRVDTGAGLVFVTTMSSPGGGYGVLRRGLSDSGLAWVPGAGPGDLPVPTDARVQGPYQYWAIGSRIRIGKPRSSQVGLEWESGPVEKFWFAKGGRIADLGFATTGSDTVLVFPPLLTPLALSRMAIPGMKPVQRLSLHDSTAMVGVTNGSRAWLIGF